MLTNVLYLIAVLALVFMFIALTGVAAVGLGWVGWLIVAIIAGLAAYFLGGRARL